MKPSSRNSSFTPRQTVVTGRAGTKTSLRPAVDSFSTNTPKFSFSQNNPAQIQKSPKKVFQKTGRQLDVAAPTQPVNRIKRTSSIGAKTAQTTYADRMFQVAPPRRWETPSEPIHTKNRIQIPNLTLWLKQQTKPQLAILSMAAFIFVFGLTASIMGFRTNSHVEAQTKKISQDAANDEDAGDHPDETDPGGNAVAEYRVDPSYPRRISIPKLGINARIKPLGTKSNNELKAPTNIYDAGWFQGSAKPGEQGATLIDGHVHGLTKPGVFYKLKKLGVGEVIEVERGDGEIFRYRVVRTQTYDRHNMDMNAAVTPVDPSLPGLNIITCTGQVEKDNNTYTDRLLIQAVLIN